MYEWHHGTSRALTPRLVSNSQIFMNQIFTAQRAPSPYDFSMSLSPTSSLYQTLLPADIKLTSKNNTLCRFSYSIRNYWKVKNIVPDVTPVMLCYKNMFISVYKIIQVNTITSHVPIAITYKYNVTLNLIYNYSAVFKKLQKHFSSGALLTIVINVPNVLYCISSPALYFANCRQFSQCVRSDQCYSLK